MYKYNHNPYQIHNADLKGPTIISSTYKVYNYYKFHIHNL